MPFRPIQAEKLSATVVKQIEQLILRGILKPGDRLPAERELAERLDVSRPSLRDAISELQTKGLLVTKASAGAYVADTLGSAFSPALVQLFSSHHESVFDTISFRRDMEGLAAERAAHHASEMDLGVVQAHLDKMEEAHSSHSAEVDARLDAEFHMSIIEASHNVIMLHMMRSMYQLLREGVFYNRQIMFKQRATRELLLDQHRAINAGLQERDPQAARAAVEEHLDYVKQCMQDEVKAKENEKVARLRLDSMSR